MTKTKKKATSKAWTCPKCGLPLEDEGPRSYRANEFCGPCFEAIDRARQERYAAEKVERDARRAKEEERARRVSQVESVEQWTLARDDAIAGLKTLEPGSVDAVVTDPPYCAGAFSEAGRRASKGQGLRSETLRDGWFEGDNMGTQGLLWLLRLLALESYRVLVDGGSLVCFADWRMVPSVAPAIESAGLRWSGQVVWDKGAMGLGRGFRRQHEFALVFNRGQGAYHDAATSDVIRCRRVKSSDRVHPAQKPVDLLRAIVRVVSPAGGLVVDPFCGSGSTGIAATQEGRRFVGFDRDVRFVRDLQRRTSDAGAPLFASLE